MQRRTKKLISLLLCLAMSTSILAGCKSSESKTDETNVSQTDGAGEESQGAEDTAAADDAGETEITFWCKDAMTTGTQETAVANEIAKKTGVRLNVVNGDAQKFKVLLAGGDLPGIVNSNYGDLGVSYNELLQSGQLIPLDQLIEENAPQLKEKYAAAIEYSKKFLSHDGQLYYLPININELAETKVVDQTGANLGFFTRYDLYKQAGSPKITNPDEYLNTLKAMQDANPQNKNGAKTYAFSGWSDWGLWIWTIPYQAMNGVINWSYGMCYDLENKEPMPTYYSEPFWDAMKFYNKAYNMGLLDPEAFTQKYDNYMDKLKNEQIFVTYANWQVKTGNDTYAANGEGTKGFQMIPTGMNYMYNSYEGDKPYGWGQDYPLALTQNCEDPVKAIKMIEYLFSDEGARLLNSGVEGVHWEVVDGVAQMTQQYRDGVAADPTYTQSEGMIYKKLSGLSASQILPDGYPAGLQLAPAEIEKALHEVDKEFIADNGMPEAVYPGQVIEAKIKDGEYRMVTQVDLTPNLTAEPTDETKNKSAQVDEYVKVGVAEVVMASEDDFEAKKEAFIKAVDEKGYADVAKEMVAIWETAQKANEDFAAQ